MLSIFHYSQLFLLTKIVYSNRIVNPKRQGKALKYVKLIDFLCQEFKGLNATAGLSRLSISAILCGTTRNIFSSTKALPQATPYAFLQPTEQRRPYPRHSSSWREPRPKRFPQGQRRRKTCRIGSHRLAAFVACGERTLLEHRSDGTDAFDTLYIGAEKFPYRDAFSINVSGVL